MTTELRLKIAITVPGDPRRAPDRARYDELVRLARGLAIDLIQNDRWVTRVVDGPRPVLARERWRVVGRRRRNARAVPDLVFAFGALPLWVPHHARLVWHRTFVRPDGMDPAAWCSRERSLRGHAARRADRIAVPEQDQLDAFIALFPFARDKVEVLPYPANPEPDVGARYLALFHRVVGR